MLKVLIIAEKYHIVNYTNDGWIINSRLDIKNLNDFLALDIPDYDIGNSKRMKHFLKYGSLDKKEKRSAEPILTTLERRQSVDTIRRSQSKIFHFSASSFDDISKLSQRPIDGSGRKRNKEWNQSEALNFDRQLRKTIKERNEERHDNHPKLDKKFTKKRVDKDEIASEKLYAKLCTFYPEYEAYITRHHTKDRSYRMMKLVERKIINDYITIKKCE